MSKFIISVKLNQIKQSFSKKYPELSYRGWMIILIFLISFTGILYLVQINSLATKGYEMKNLDEQISELKAKNKKLEIQIAELSSTERILAQLDKMDMVEVARVEYLKANGTSVAINR